MEEAEQQSHLALPAEKHYYTLLHIVSCTAVAGVVGGFWMLARNHRALGEAEEARKSMLTGFAVAAVLFTAVFLLPRGVQVMVPKWLVLLLYTGAVFALARRQEPRIKALAAAGAQPHSPLSVAATFFVGLLAFLGTGLLLLTLYRGLGLMR